MGMTLQHFVHCSHSQHNSLSMHINMHYTPSTTDPTAFHNPPLYTTNKHNTYLCKMAQDVGMVWKCCGVFLI